MVLLAIEIQSLNLFAPLNAVPFQAPVKRTAAETESVRRLADIALTAIEGLPDEQLFDLLQRQLFELRMIMAVRG